MLAVALLSSPIVTACAKTDVPVPIHGVNYTAEPFSFVLIDPKNKENRGGGEEIEPFAAGGTVCCFTLPSKWRPGLKIEIAETYWVPPAINNKLPENRKKHVVDVPSYADGKVGELWVIRAPGGVVSIVSSDLQPDHLRWPGKIKGWPVPSIAHQRKIQDMYIKDALGTVELFSQALDELKKNPKGHARDMWEIGLGMTPDERKLYSGYNDPAYLAKLKKYHSESLVEAREKYRQLRAARP